METKEHETHYQPLSRHGFALSMVWSMIPHSKKTTPKSGASSLHWSRCGVSIGI
jgi:hypothetical protein